MALPSSAQRVQDALAARGFPHTVRELPASARTAAEAAAALGCEVAHIVKSLVFRTRPGGRPVLVVASGAQRVSEARVQALVGEEVEKASADFVREHTGFAIGGVAPLAHPHPLLTLVDEGLLQHGRLWAAAGHPHAVFSLTPGELVAMTGGRVERVSG